VSQLLYHATLNERLTSIIRHGLLPTVGPFTRAAHDEPCPLHPDPARIHVARRFLDIGLLNALCFHVIRLLQSHLGFNDAFLTDRFEPGWLLPKDLAAFGAVVEVEVEDDEVCFQEHHEECCTCLEDGDLYLTRPASVKQLWTHAPLFNGLNSQDVVDHYRAWIEVDCSGSRRMNDGLYLLELRPDALAGPCPNAEALLSRVRSQYRRSVTELNLAETG
jgi:hypothetical protein